MENNISTLETMFFKYFSIADEDIKKLYLFRFSKLDNVFLAQRLNKLIDTWVPNFGRKYPSIAEILGTTEKEAQLELQSAIDKNWEYFKKNMCNNLAYKDMPEDVATWKRLLSAERCETMSPTNESWLKKEFADIYHSTKDKTMLALEPKIARSEFLNLITEVKKKL